MENETRLDTAYEVDYTIDDPAFHEPFEIYKSVNQGLNPWWQYRSKVEKLIEAFKMDLTIHQACIYAGITASQYKYFCQVHPTFVMRKGRLKGILAIAAKQGLVRDISSRDGARSRQWYLERKEPERYGNHRANAVTAPEGATSITTIMQRAFADKDGKILVTEASASIVENHANPPSQT